MTPLDRDPSNIAVYLRHSNNEDILVVLNMNGIEVDDLKLSLEQSGLAPGKYTAQVLLDLKNTGGTINPLTVGDKGSIKDFVLTQNLPGFSGYVILLKKS